MKQKGIQLTLPVCCTCLSTSSDNVTSYCINGHDDWLEERDFQAMPYIDRTDYPDKNVYPEWMTQIEVLKRFAKRRKVSLSSLKLLL